MKWIFFGATLKKNRCPMMWSMVCSLLVVRMDWNWRLDTSTATSEYTPWLLILEIKPPRRLGGWPSGGVVKSLTCSTDFGIRALSMTLKSAEAMISAGLFNWEIMRAILVLPPPSRWMSIPGLAVSNCFSIFANGTVRLPAWNIMTLSPATAGKVPNPNL